MLLLSLGAGGDSPRGSSGEPEKIPANVEAAAPSKIDRLWAAPYGLSGRGVVIGAWDEGIVQASHPDLTGRVTLAETGTIAGHSTHVAGTLIGSGFAMPAAKGMAPGSTLLSYDYYGDVLGQQLAAQSSYGMVVSNHSWNYAAGWVYNRYGGGKWVWYGGAANTKDPDFGAYDYIAQAWDKLVADRGLIIVKSAGNDRGDKGAGSSLHYHIGDSATLHTDWHGPDGDYDSIGQIGAAKNLITVGAVDQAGGMTAFSAWGPTDDGRVKPDIVANGVSIYSTWLNNGYNWLSGTSMSTPVVSGAVALIVERYRAIANGETPSPHLVKALLAHSAQDLGNKGPDYVYGWGMLDAEAAVILVNDGVGPGRRIESGRVTGNAQQTYSLTVPASTPSLKVTIVWTDPPAAPGAPKALVNDLDLELVAPDGRVYHPYSLAGLTNPSAPATAVGPNRVDNIEQVVVEAPVAGSWQARVNGTAVRGSQDYVLVNSAAPVASAASLSISINQGAIEVPSRDVTVSLRGSSEVGVSGYHLSENSAPPSATNFTPVPTAASFQSDLPYTLSAGGGNKTVYAWLRDASGNVSAQTSETVTLAAVQSAGGGGAVDVLVLAWLGAVWWARVCRAGIARL